LNQLQLKMPMIAIEILVNVYIGTTGSSTGVRKCIVSCFPPRRVFWSRLLVVVWLLAAHLKIIIDFAAIVDVQVVVMVVIVRPQGVSALQIFEALRQ
jgi:hypothetical protein